MDILYFVCNQIDPFYCYSCSIHDLHYHIYIESCFVQIFRLNIIILAHNIMKPTNNILFVGCVQLYPNTQRFQKTVFYFKLH